MPVLDRSTLRRAEPAGAGAMRMPVKRPTECCREPTEAGRSDAAGAARVGPRTGRAGPRPAGGPPARPQGALTPPSPWRLCARTSSFSELLLHCSSSMEPHGGEKKKKKKKKIRASPSEHFTSC
ncbi:hypothetical protein EYF80_058030 [Liparis tanakae]|uniref:Uncharacterized protein n=1 Tax=Liparis tanakae TaxID=230148 RepID=A0A4Z2EU66_9TELE|nr:hypothetical protein EYF80_058030 [Liparis tanakae]